MINEILEQAREEYKTIKRNPSGSVNGNALLALRNRTKSALIAAGVDNTKFSGNAGNDLSMVAVMVNNLLKDLQDK
jgi:hypothetical protein